MGRKSKNDLPEFLAKIAEAAIRGDKTIPQDREAIGGLLKWCSK
jgi:hypothetical protein